MSQHNFVKRCLLNVGQGSLYRLLKVLSSGNITPCQQILMLDRGCD
jgi:hypothetical protein